MAEPIRAETTVGRIKRIITVLFLRNRMQATRVPQEEESLLVAIALCAGSPASRYAGKVMSPPPPAMESTKPPRKTRGQTIRNICSVSCMSESFQYVFGM